MTRFRLQAAVACVATLALTACNKGQPAPQAASPTEKPASAPAVARKAVEEKPAPYTYPPPVKGHYKEINTGSFDLVDGIAFPAGRGAGTVVYVTSKPIASPVLVSSDCPMTQARVLTELRNGSYVEVTLDASGRSKYFAAGMAFGGSSREQEVGGHSWSSKLGKGGTGRATGSVRHKQYGGFEFDLPLSSPKVNEVSQGDWSQGHRADETAPRPTEQAVVAAYRAVREAALKKDLKALLAALGFDEKQIAAIAGLDGIDADLAVYADRFLQPGDPEEFTARPGTAYVASRGTNSQGKKFANFYHFAPCGDRLVLVSIAENPQ